MGGCLCVSTIKKWNEFLPLGDGRENGKKAENGVNLRGII
jgi:hypothetical protein